MKATQNPLKPIHVRNSSCFTSENLDLLMQNMTACSFSQGSTLFREGDENNRLYYLHSGKVKTTKLTEGGKEFILALYHAGDFIGQFDAFQDSKLRFSAQVVEAGKLSYIHKENLNLLLWQYGELSIDFMKWMGFMQQLTQTKYRDLVMYGKPGALCSTLIRLANTYGIRNTEGITITLRLTHAELADYIGSTRESVNRMLGDLRQAGTVRVDHGLITITDLQALQHICKCELCPMQLCRL